MAYGEMLSDLKSLLTDAVSIRCDRRFNAGAHVSSGLDSGTVAALARREYASQAQFNGYSWSPAAFSPPEMKYDERDLVRSLCNKADIDPVFSDITSREFLARISRFYINKGYFIEESILDQAAAAGTNLMFSGWGGDEFISTGDRGIETDLLRGLHLKTYFRRNPVRPFRRFAKYFLQYSLLPALGIMERNVARSFADDARYLKRPLKKSDRRALGNFYFHTSRRQLASEAPEVLSPAGEMRELGCYGLHEGGGVSLPSPRQAHSGIYDKSSLHAALSDRLFQTSAENYWEKAFFRMMFVLTGVKGIRYFHPGGMNY